MVNRQTDKHTERERDEERGIHDNTDADRQTDKRAGTETDRQTDQPADSLYKTILS